MNHIYALVDPETFEPRYVGVTSDPERRLDQHLRYEAGLYGKDEWIVYLRTKGLVPKMVILEKVASGSGTRQESVWIHKLHEIGYDLFNSQVARTRRQSWHPVLLHYVVHHPGWAARNGYAERFSSLDPFYIYGSK